MLACCNNSTFQLIQLFANMRENHPKLFNLFNIANHNINSTLKQKRIDFCNVQMKSRYYLKFSKNVFMVES